MLLPPTLFPTRVLLLPFPNQFFPPPSLSLFRGLNIFVAKSSWCLLLSLGKEYDKTTPYCLVFFVRPQSYYVEIRVFSVICHKFAIKRLHLTLYGQNQAYFRLFLTVLNVLLPPCFISMYYRMTSDDRRSFVGSGGKDFPYHNSMKIRRRKGEKKTIRRCLFSGELPSSSLFSLMPINCPFYLETNFYFTTEETTTQVNKQFSTPRGVGDRPQQYQPHVSKTR